MQVYGRGIGKERARTVHRVAVNGRSGAPAETETKVNDVNDAAFGRALNDNGKMGVRKCEISRQTIHACECHKYDYQSNAGC